MQSQSRAPLCSHPGCTRRTWDAVCWQHRGATPGGAAQDIQGVPMPTLNPPQFRSVGECWDSVSRVFPDINDVVHPHSIRAQVDATTRSAVSVEVYRKFSALDIPDADQRDLASQDLGIDIVTALRPEPNDVTPEQAEELLHSSSDRYGRGIDGSAALASYGLRCEWELANLQGVEVDQDGVPYGLPFAQYCELTAPAVTAQASEQYRVELGRFPDIIRDLHGRPPLNSRPMALGLTVDGEPVEPDPVEEEQALYAASEEERRARIAAHQEELAHEREVKRQALKSVAKGVALHAALYAVDADGTRRARKRQSRIDHEMDEIREGWRRDIAAREAARRRAQNRRRGF